jgi:hypothetical protein
MDRLFTICYLPVCLLLLGVVIKFNSMPARPRILTSFAAFTLIMLGLPLVREWKKCSLTPGAVRDMPLGVSWLMLSPVCSRQPLTAAGGERGGWCVQVPAQVVPCESRGVGRHNRGTAGSKFVQMFSQSCARQPCEWVTFILDTALSYSFPSLAAG